MQTAHPRRWHIITCEYPPVVGGVGSYTAQFASELARQSGDVHVWTDGSEDGHLFAADPGVHVHRVQNAFRWWRGIAHLDRALAREREPRTLLIQWVPHGYGYESMNLPFCVWVAKRRFVNHDRVELVVHEPFLDFSGSARQQFAAVIHRGMMGILMMSAHQVWVASPGWTGRLRRWPFTRRPPIAWSPISGGIVSHEVPPESREYNGPGTVVGCFIGKAGIRDRRISMLAPILAELFGRDTRITATLIGKHAEMVRLALCESREEWTARMVAVTAGDDADVARALSASDVMLQVYPGGITARHSTALAAAQFGCAIVANDGRHTEAMFHDERPVLLVPEDDAPATADAIVSLLLDSGKRATLGRTAREFRERHFNLESAVARIVANARTTETASLLARSRAPE